MSLGGAVKDYLDAEVALGSTIQAGDRITVLGAKSRWERAVQDLHQSICAVANQWMWNPILGYESEDVAQEVLYKFLDPTKGPRDNDEHATRWIRLVTRRRIYDLLRKERVRESAGPLPPTGEEDREDVSEAGELEEEDWEEASLDPGTPLLPGGKEMQGPDDQEADSAQKGRARPSTGRLLPIDAGGEEGTSGTEGPEEPVIGKIQLEQWREKLHRALDAGHKAVSRTRLEDPDTKRRIFEETVLYEQQTANEIVANAPPGSSYAPANRDKKEWGRAINLVQQHAVRYRKALKKAIEKSQRPCPAQRDPCDILGSCEGEDLCPGQRTILSNVILYVEKKEKDLARGRACQPDNGRHVYKVKDRGQPLSNFRKVNHE